MKTWIEISKSRLLGNAVTFARLLQGKSGLVAVVKANAYGHGLLPVARTIAQAKEKIISAGAKELWFGVDNAEEGITLRRAGIRTPILVLGYTPFSLLAKAVRAKLDLTIASAETIRHLPRGARVHLKLETGTTRQGVGERDAAVIVKALARDKHVTLAGLSTHFANIEDTTDHSYAMGQLGRFKNMAAAIQRVADGSVRLHAAATAATLLFSETHFDLARVGLGLYGFWPSKETRAIVSSRSSSRGVTLKPALTWKTIVAQIKDVPTGTPVSYGLTERVARQSRVAVLPIGYYDGYDRKLSSVGTVLIRGKRAKVLGRVCMNMLMVDVTDIPRARQDDEVVIIGEQGSEVITVDDLAGKIGSINYEVVTRLNPLIPRLLVR